VDIDIAELWEALTEYLPGRTYDKFKDAIYKLYPGSEDDWKWWIADMDKLVGEQQRLKILSTVDLGQYYRAFFAITAHLISKGRLSQAEQSRAFLRGFHTELRELVTHRLELKYPDHHPDDPYDLEYIHEAVKFVLHGTGPSAFQTRLTSPHTSSETSDSSKFVKAEDVTSMLETLAQTLVKALVPAQSTSSGTSSEFQPRPPNNGLCNFCGGSGHFISDCKMLVQYIIDGKCKKNAEGKVVLPSGAFPPRSLGGRNLSERIDEYHRRNPKQLAAAQVSSNTTLMYDIVSPQVPTILSRDSDTTQRSSYQLSTAEHIDSLEKELFTLRNGKRFDGVEVPRFKRPNHPPPANRPPRPAAPERPPQPEKQNAQPSTSTPLTDGPSASANSGPAAPIAPIVPDPSDPPIHPFANVKETTYLPPHEHNFGAPAPKPPKEKEAAYRTQAPIQDPKIAEEVYARTLKAPVVTLSLQELWALSPEV
jgi:hypothetical protein